MKWNSSANNTESLTFSPDYDIDSEPIHHKKFGAKRKSTFKQEIFVFIEIKAWFDGGKFGLLIPSIT